MKIYFYSKKESTFAKATEDKSSSKEVKDEKKEAKGLQEKTHENIFKFFKDNGLVVLSNLTLRSHETEQLSFENMDGLVVEGSSAENEAGYLIAMALAQQKPILYLLPKGSVFPDHLRSLKENKKIKKLFMLHYYSQRTLENFLIDFIDIIETGELRRQVPVVKFTLRFTPRADRYITWQSRKKKISKADFLRKLIDEQIKGNDEYQSHLRKPKMDDDKS